MAAKNPARVFTAFDYDHDEALRNLLVGQSKHEDSPFEMHDWSIKQPFTGDWREKVRTRIRSVDQVIVLCGEHTHTATGVSAELTIAREEKKPLLSAVGILQQDLYEAYVCLQRRQDLQMDLGQPQGVNCREPLNFVCELPVCDGRYASALTSTDSAH